MNLWLPEGEGWGKGKLGSQGSTCTPIFKMDNQEGTSEQHMEVCSTLCGSLDGRGVWGRMNTCICKAEFPCCSSETVTILLTSYSEKKVKVLVIQSCLTLCDPMDCSLPDSSVRGILQAIILEWVAIPFSRGSSQPRDRTQVSHIASRLFTS